MTASKKSVQLQGKDLEEIRAAREAVSLALHDLMQLVIPRLHGTEVTFSLGGVKLRFTSSNRTGTQNAAKVLVPDVTVFEDENENCVGMYIDPPGICTDQC